MAEYIKREAALNICQKEYEDCLKMHDYCGDSVAWNIGGAIKGLPAADVAPVVHGRWIDPEDDDGGTLWYCSKCGYPVKTIAKPNCNYCPKCGCKMREGNDGTK
ncbi:hypothetical protein [Anaerotruncus rubiinfantis]|uniref:hypothetical protein n=2 Tax=Anaerotruncus rubiinfantis TaxID=1720200 RepID=UPI0011CA5E46|nr:hypothetical protein [Anaerotruncus rubiinfantis]